MPITSMLGLVCHMVNQTTCGRSVDLTHFIMHHSPHEVDGLSLVAHSHVSRLGLLLSEFAIAFVSNASQRMPVDRFCVLGAVSSTSRG